MLQLAVDFACKDGRRQEDTEAAVVTHRIEMEDDVDKDAVVVGVEWADVRSSGDEGNVDKDCPGIEEIQHDRRRYYHEAVETAVAVAVVAGIADSPAKFVAVNQL